ncbi:MAG: type II secretion system protein [Oscillospiraceae bacterium]|nr:type II secretion system protein [Oscillospiraceae bacterium]
MEKTGKQRTAGFTLVEIIVAIAIMGLVSAPICASLVLAGRLNARSRAVMEAELNVRSAVETLMEAGVTGASNRYGYDAEKGTDQFPKVIVKTEDTGAPYYKVTVSDNSSEPLVTVETYIRRAAKGGDGG